MYIQREGARERVTERKKAARETRCQPGNRRMVSPRRCVTRANNERRGSEGGETDRQARKRHESGDGETTPDEENREAGYSARSAKEERESRGKRKGNANGRRGEVRVVGGGKCGGGWGQTTTTSGKGLERVARRSGGRDARARGDDSGDRGGSC